MTAAPRIRLVDQTSFRAPLGLVFWDVATGERVRDGLVASIAPSARPGLAKPMFANDSGIWVTGPLPPLGQGATWRVEAMDPLGRFLPLRVEVAASGTPRFKWPAGLPKPAFAKAPAGGAQPSPVPLFSAPSRSIGPAAAEVRAQLVHVPESREAAWALLTVSHSGRTRGVGLADGRGSVVVHFPWPERPARRLADPQPGNGALSWQVEVAGFGAPPATDREPEEIPDLADLLAKLDEPRILLAAADAPGAMPAQPLEFGRTSNLVTESDGPASLMLAAA
jgi:hypothetical protein